MHHRFWLLCATLAVLRLSVSTDARQTAKATSTSPPATTFSPSPLAVLRLSVSTDAGQTTKATSTSPPATTFSPSQSAATRNVSTNTNTESFQPPFDQQRALSALEPTGQQRALGTLEPTGQQRALGALEPTGHQRALGALEPTGQVSDVLRNPQGNASEYECECPDWDCVCSSSTGKIVSYDFDGYKTWSFQVDGAPSSSPILVKVYFYASGVPNTDRDWQLYIGSSTLFKKASELRNKTEVYILSNERILFNKTVSNLNIELFYEALVPVHVTEIIPGNDVKGIIRFPTNTSKDVELGYIQQHRQMWIFDYPANYIIELNLTKVDLGYRQADLHWKSTLNDEIENDFLLIGLSTEIMKNTDKVLYGHLDEMVTIRINHPSAHIVLFSSYHEQWAGGFDVRYTAVEVTIPPSTTTPAPTTQAAQLGVLPSTLATIDDAQKGNYSAVSSSFSSAVAGMATEYVSTHGLDVEPPSVIEPSDVVVYWTATCMQGTCSQYCMAFNFSIHKETKAGSAWAFSAKTLDLMIRDEALQSYWKVIHPDCEFCDETVTVNWYLFGGVAAGAVLLAALISLVVWKIKNVVGARKSKREIEADMKQEELERRRRSSGDESVIGGLKGGTRMSLPFGAARGSVNSEHSSQDDETDDYPEHDPDFGYDNFGLGSDLVNDKKARNFYSNAGFEPETSPSDHIGYKQLQQAALAVHQPTTSSQGLPLKPVPILKSSLKKRALSSLEANGTPTTLNSALRVTPKKVITIVEEEDEESFTDSDDSDGTVQFKSAALGPRKQFSIQADVHHPGDSEFGETVL